MASFISVIVAREVFGRYKVQIPGTASRIALERMEDVVRACPKVRRLLLSYTEALLAQTFQTVFRNSVHKVEVRCCNWILTTRDRVDADLLPLTQADLADFLGVQRSTVTTALGTLTPQARGLIAQQRAGISIANRKGLEAKTCECYDRIRQIYARLLPAPPSRG